MASEESGESTVEISIPHALEQWLDLMSDEWDVGRDTLIRQLLAAHQVSATLDGISDSNLNLDEAGESIATSFNQLLISSNESLKDQFSDIEHEVTQLEHQYSRDLEDVRKRVVQLKRELNSKANTSHSHPEIVEEIKNRSEDDVELKSGIERLADEIDKINEKVDAGFANFRKIIEQVIRQHDQHDEQLDKFASILLRYRDDLSSVSQLVADQRLLEDLTSTAIRNGVRTAACGNCQTTIDLGILSTPQCPECSARFERLQPKDGFFGNSHLIVEDPPALETGEETDGFTFGRKSAIDEIGTTSKPNIDRTVRETENA